MKKKWQYKTSTTPHIAEGNYDELLTLLLTNRSIVSDSEREVFLHPDIQGVTVAAVGIDEKQLQKTLKRFIQAFEKKEQMIVYGDYDVDGITGSAILWETLYALGFTVLPYIPHRVDEGYGLSLKGIDNLRVQNPDCKLIVTVDNGIVAHEAVAYANTLGIDVIITDHHVPEGNEKQPDAFTIVHTTKICGASVAYLLAREIQNFMEVTKQIKGKEYNHIELAALGTVADLVPLTGANRTIVSHGLKQLRKTNRPGLLSLFQEATIRPENISAYQVGYVIGPRLNAAGRIESAMDSLRLLCTRDVNKAVLLAGKLGATNRQRQDIMKEATTHALKQLQTIKEEKKMKKIIFIGDASYNPGVIGLVAGRLVEEFYRPAIVLSIGEKYAKASVRSVSGVNIIAFLRRYMDMFVNIGGHPMAAGFTVAVEKMPELQQKLEELAEKQITDELLQRSLSIDCDLPFSAITPPLYKALQQLAPFGMGNSEPVFVTKGVLIKDIRYMGREGKHVKLTITDGNNKKNQLEAIGFSMAELFQDVKQGDTIAIAYSLDENRWNGNVSLQLKLKDIHSLK